MFNTHLYLYLQVLHSLVSLAGVTASFYSGDQREFHRCTGPQLLPEELRVIFAKNVCG